MEARCGTYAGYLRHKRLGEPFCDDCRAVNNDYMRKYRQDPIVRKREADRNTARSRALWRLAREFPDRFHALYIDEIKQVKVKR